LWNDIADHHKKLVEYSDERPPMVPALSSDDQGKVKTLMLGYAEENKLVCSDSMATIKKTKTPPTTTISVALLTTKEQLIQDWLMILLVSLNQVLSEKRAIGHVVVQDTSATCRCKQDSLQAFHDQYKLPPPIDAKPDILLLPMAKCTKKDGGNVEHQDIIKKGRKLKLEVVEWMYEWVLLFVELKHSLEKKDRCFREHKRPPKGLLWAPVKVVKESFGQLMQRVISKIIQMTEVGGLS
jgi:hypothetical protein